MAASITPLRTITSSPVPDISVQKLQMCGLMVDVYGLSELSSTATHISILWLLHPRLNSKENMDHIARATLSAWHKNSVSELQQGRGMIAAAWDQRNHGGRTVDPKKNEAWKDGNETHAQDMYGTIAGCVADARGLIDAVGGYLFLDGDVTRQIDQHLVLGVSMGGHAAWQLMFVDERVEAGVMVIGTPDFTNLLRDRARLSRRATFKAEDETSFWGSKDFPLALVEACKRGDPKAIIFGTGPISETPKDASEEAQWRTLFDQHNLGRKRFLSCCGADDKLVPYKASSEQFMKFLEKAACTWYKDKGLRVKDSVYPGVGHFFSLEMGQDAIKFLMDAVRDKERERLALGPKM